MTFAPTRVQSRTYFENRLGGKLPSRNQVMVRCPWHHDQTPSMSINLQDGVWSCHACNVAAPQAGRFGWIDASRHAE
jgi:hypothetical protein